MVRHTDPSLWFKFSFLSHLPIERWLGNAEGVVNIQKFLYWRANMQQESTPVWTTGCSCPGGIRPLNTHILGAMMEVSKISANIRFSKDMLGGVGGTLSLTLVAVFIR